jgi:hypothetical protein
MIATFAIIVPAQTNAYGRIQLRPFTKA